MAEGGGPPERSRDRHTADVLSGRCHREALKPAPEEALRNWTVSPQLNRTGVGDDDDPTAIEPLASPGGAQQGAARIRAADVHRCRHLCSGAGRGSLGGIGSRGPDLPRDAAIQRPQLPAPEARGRGYTGRGRRGVRASALHRRRPAAAIHATAPGCSAPGWSWSGRVRGTDRSAHRVAPGRANEPSARSNRRR
jgi:hypothetical protein